MKKYQNSPLSGPGKWQCRAGGNTLEQNRRFQNFLYLRETHRRTLGLRWFLRRLRLPWLAVRHWSGSGGNFRSRTAVALLLDWRGSNRQRRLLMHLILVESKTICLTYLQTANAFEWMYCMNVIMNVWKRQNLKKEWQLPPNIYTQQQKYFSLKGHTWSELSLSVSIWRLLTRGFFAGGFPPVGGLLPALGLTWAGLSGVAILIAGLLVFVTAAGFSTAEGLFGWAGDLTSFFAAPTEWEIVRVYVST